MLWLCQFIVKPYSDRDRYFTSVGNLKDITTIVIPFFEKYPIYGAKYLDFKDFCKGISIMEKKGHITQVGLDQQPERLPTVWIRSESFNVVLLNLIII